MISELIRKCRTYRRFDNKIKISDETLLSFIENASLAPSGGNLQPLKYKIVNNIKDNEELFKHLKWAGYLRDWDGPCETERPSSYIIILGDLSISKDFGVDLGICSYAIVLSAAEKGIGSCMIGSVDRKAVREYFGISDRYDVLLVIALGCPAENVVLEKTVDGDIRYYRDALMVHHVPKRDIGDIIIK